MPIRHEEAIPFEEPHVIDVLSESYPKIFAVETSWANLNTEIQRHLSDENISQVADSWDEFLETPNTGVNGRAEHRANSRKPDVKAAITNSAVRAKWNAQMCLWGNEATKTEYRNNLDGLREITHSEDTCEAERYLPGLELSLSLLYITAYESEDDLLSPLYDILTQDAGQLEELLVFLEDPDNPAEEYTGLRFALARHHYDPIPNSVITACAEALGDLPSLRKNNVTRGAMNTVIDSEKHPEKPLTESEQWLRLFGKFALSHKLDFSDISTFLAATDFADLPVSLQSSIESDGLAHSRELEQRLVALIEPYRRPKRFVLPENPDSLQTTKRTISKKGKRTRGSNGRVTPKMPSSSNLVEAESNVPLFVSEVVFAKNTPSGNHTEPLAKYDATGETLLKDWVDVTIEEILQQRAFANYTKKYQNSKDVAEMLRSILSNPKGDGVSAMSGQRESFINPECPSKPTKKNVLHFSPQDSSGINFSQSTQSNRTRIFYCVDGQKLILLDIQHKTQSEHLRGSFRR